MSGARSYTRYELLRTFRNRRFFIFSLVFPLVLYWVIAGPNKNESDFGDSGIDAPLYYMAGLAAFGTMMAMLSSGGRIAGEREVGWNRQLRISPLSTGAYFRAKVVTAYAMAAVSIALLFASGVILGVRLSAGHWVELTALLLIGLAPFAALGIWIGLLLTFDTIGPVMGGLGSLLALLGGTWFPLGDSGVMFHIAQCLPSYWLVQASHVALGGDAWGTTGWTVMAAWTVVGVAGARHAYRRDTSR